MASRPPASACLLGLDLGSTCIKAALFDARGRVLGSASAPVPVRTPQPGWTERDAETTWRLATSVVRRAVRAHAARVSVVGVTGCGNGGVFLDATGAPVRAGILASDTRAAAFTGPREYPGQTAVLLRWLRAHESRTARRLHRVLFWKDFVRLRLTGESATEPTDVGAAGDFARGEPALAPVRASLAQAGEVSSAAARITGLRAGTPVFTGCLDCEAAAIGSGVSGPGELSIAAGTWAINQGFVSKRPAAAARRTLFLVNPSAQPGRWLVLEGSPNSASHFDWLARALGRSGDFARLAAEAAAAPRGGPIFVPGLFGAGAAFAGLKAAHDRGALARAVMEGVCFAHRAHVAKLGAAGLRFRSARLAGGAARSPFWCQLFADVLGLPVAVPRAAEPGALGAALIAGVGAGLWPSLAAAQRATVTVAARYLPRDNYDADYARYCRLAPVLFAP